MILGTKARYAVMALVDLARQGCERPVVLSDIAARQEISLAYLEQIFPKLKKAGLVKAVRGPGGGYLLNHSACQTPILVIVEAVDESLKMTRCGNLEHAGACHAPRGCHSSGAACSTHALWEGLGKQIAAYLSAISLADVVGGAALPQGEIELRRAG